MRNTESLSLTIRLPADQHSALCAKPNRSAWVRNAISEKLQRETSRPVKPRTSLGRKLLAAREEYRVTGGRPLSLDEVRLEVSRRRGGEMTRTYLDSSVLIQAVQGVDGDKAAALLEALGSRCTKLAV